MKKITKEMQQGLWGVLAETVNFDVYFVTGKPYTTRLGGETLFAKSKEEATISFENNPNQYPYILESLIHYVETQYKTNLNKQRNGFVDGLMSENEAGIYFLSEGKDLGGITIGFDKNGNAKKYSIVTNNGLTFAQGSIVEDHIDEVVR